MDPRFVITDAPRTVPPATAPDVPLVTVAWRALRSDYQRRAEERRKQETQTQRLLDALADVAEHAHRLGEADRFADLLSRAGLIVVRPIGAAFDDGLMEIFDNVAQTEDATIAAPTVAEVIVPAVLYDAGLLRRGKAVIAVPPAPCGE